MGAQHWKLDHVPLTSLRQGPDFADVVRAGRARDEHVTGCDDLPEALLHVEVVG